MSDQGWTPGLNLHRALHSPASITSLLNPEPLPEPPALDASSVRTYESHIAIKSSSLGGQGIFATKKIPAKSCILVDPALIGLEEGENFATLLKKYEALPREEQATFDALVAVPMRERDRDLRAKLLVRGFTPRGADRQVVMAQRWLTNAFSIIETSDPEPLARTWLGQELHACDDELRSSTVRPHALAHAVFPKVARANHSCLPNAHSHYDPLRRSRVMYSLRPIEAGEEITIAYFDTLKSLSVRRDRMSHWGFICRCPACSNGPEAIEHEKTARLVTAFAEDVHREHMLGFRPGERRLRELLPRMQANPGFKGAIPPIYEMLGGILINISEESGDRRAWHEGLALFKKALQAQIDVEGRTSPMSRRRAWTVQATEGESYYRNLHSTPRSRRSARMR